MEIVCSFIVGGILIYALLYVLGAVYNWIVRLRNKRKKRKTIGVPEEKHEQTNK